MDEDTAREWLARTGHAMAAAGLARGTSGNVGMRLDGERFLVSATGVACGTMKPADAVPMFFDGRHEGPLLPSSEWRFHRDILQARPELHGVVHCHSPHATAVAVMGRAIPAIHYDVAAAGGADIRCAPYATFGTADLAVAVMDAMADRKACLLAHHGQVAAGTDLDDALALAVKVEELAQLYLLCLPAGEPPVLPDAEIALVVEKYRSYGRQPAFNAP